MISDADLDELGLTRLPRNAELLLERVSSPARLVAHLTLVHDVAWRLLDALESAFPGLRLPREEILFGAAIHDIGKAVVRSELSEPGHSHEHVGRELLRSAGVSETMSRFSITHADLDQPGTNLSDALVALSDKCWKGKRDEDIEGRVSRYLALELHLPDWEIFDRLDAIINKITEAADHRLEWQRRFGA